ncbi:MAG: GNAT family N-acetyltransferase, partial [Spirochaetales bacterium]|nr:GNAT family N-acetyltransferase [Spirochaetales bacterium]
ACVAPVFRRQGVYSALYDSLRDETLAPGSRPVLLVCSGNSAEGARIAGSSGASVTRSRYRMILTSSCLEKIAAPDCVRLVPVTDENAEEASRVSAAIFNRAPVDACCFMKALLADPVREQFLVVASRGTVGLVGVASAGTDYCVHGLGVLPQFRTGGYGAGALDAVLSVLKERRVGLVALDVDTNNAAALSLLRSRGFAVASRADYWLLPGARKDSQ